jgi:HlyD family secretion protein
MAGQQERPSMENPPDPNAPTEPSLGAVGADGLERTSLGSGGLGAFRERVRQSLALRILLVVVALAIVAAAALPAYIFYSRPHPAFARANVGDITLTVKGQGSVQAMIYSASFAIPGVIAQINVVPGQRVQAGDTLATLDTTAAQAAVRDAQTAASDAQSDVDAAATAVTDAQTALTSAQSSLSEQEAYVNTACSQTPADEVDCAAAEAAQARAQAQVDAAQAQVSAALTQQARAQVSLDNAQSALTAAQMEMAATTLIAPHAGIALTVNGQVGDSIGVSGQAFITIADTAQPLATVLISYRDISGVEPSESATLRVPQATGTSTVKGIVEGFALIPQGSGDHLSYPVMITIDPNSIKSGASLLPGMSASATIITRQVLGVVTLPVSAVTYAHQAAPANGKGLLTKEQISAALGQANQLEQAAIANGLDTQHDPPTATYLIGFSGGKYVAIPAVLGLSDGKNQEIIAGVNAGDLIVNGQRNPFQS